DVGQFRQRAGDVVDDAGRERAGSFRHRHRLEKVVALSRLGHGQKELTAEVQLLPVDGRYVGRKRADRYAEMALDQVFSEGRGMRRTPACAREHEARWSASE